jgi:eukaryotic-like serine/threonine-protein kinase
MSSCPDDNLLAAYLEGGLKPALRGAVRRHLTSCPLPRCRAALEPREGPGAAAPRLPAERDLSGRVLCRRYELERLLDSGAMGQVYVAKDLRTGGPVAVKVLIERWIENEEIYRRFREEASIGAALNHPHIVHVQDFDHDEESNPFLVMELLSGETLHARLKRQGRLDVAEALEMAAQAGSALHAAHQRGVVHRDIKPQNIFIAQHDMSNQKEERVKLLDFGIAKIRSAGGHTSRDQMIGTPAYMAPEAVRGKSSDVDARADQWSLAVVLYRTLAGRPPFPAAQLEALFYHILHEEPPPLAELNPDVPPFVLQAIARAMSKRQEDRFPTTADFVHALLEGAEPRSHLVLRRLPPAAADPRVSPRVLWFVLATVAASFWLTFALIRKGPPPRRLPPGAMLGASTLAPARAPPAGIATPLDLGAAPSADMAPGAAAVAHPTSPPPPSARPPARPHRKGPVYVDP